jgi:hypothetical protein
MCQNCIDLNIPERLWLNQREKDDAFDDDSLYRRFKVFGDKLTWSSNKLSHVVFKLDKDSYNKSSLCEKPTDVLYNTRLADNGNHYVDFGILELPCNSLNEINDIPISIELNGVRRAFRLQPVHSPLDCMYPHSEVLIYEGDLEINIKTPKSIGVVIRDILIEKINIIKDPGIVSEL